MSVILQTVGPQVLIASLPWWFYEVRIGWLGMTFFDRVSMRWLDVIILGALGVCIFVFWRHAQVAGDRPVVRVFRVAMLMSMALALCLAVMVILTFILVPYVPAHYPPATPATWISLGMDSAAPVTAILASLSFVVSLLYVFTRNTRAEPIAGPNERERGHAS
jgi:hypothetical protein